MVENIHTVKGTLFSKDEKSGANKKAGEPDWKMCIVKIEADVQVNGKKINTVCEYIFDWNVSFDEFSVGDPIEADFYIVNKKIKRKDGNGTWEKEEKRILFMKFSDITTPERPKTTGKVQVTSMTNPEELTNPKKNTVFTGARPTRPVLSEEEEDDNSDLPF